MTIIKRLILPGAALLFIMACLLHILFRSSKTLGWKLKAGAFVAILTSACNSQGCAPVITCYSQPQPPSIEINQIEVTACSDITGQLPEYWGSPLLYKITDEQKLSTFSSGEVVLYPESLQGIMIGFSVPVPNNLSPGFYIFTILKMENNTISTLDSRQIEVISP